MNSIINNIENIEVYDMLVFEDEEGSIYQDCVCSITNDPVYIAANENEIDEYFHTVTCNQVELVLDNEYNVIKINEINYNGNHTYKLKEIWTRTDEDTYKRVWQLGTDRSIIDKLVGDSTRTIQTVIDDGSYLESEEGKKKLAEIKKLLYREARNFTFKADFGKPIKEYLTQNNLIQDKESE